MHRTLLCLALLVGCSENNLHSGTSPDNEGVESALLLTPSTLNLGTLQPGGSAMGAFTLTATGGPVTVDEVALSDAAFVLEDAPSGLTLQPDESVPVEVSFAAVSPGQFDARLTVSSTASAGGSLEGVVEVTVAAALEPDIAVNPLSLAIDTGTTAFVAVQSVGTDVLDVTSVAIDGASDPGFAVVDSGALPGLLAIGNTVQVEVGYTGSGGTGTLVITSDDPDEAEVRVALTGTGADCTAVDADNDGANACDDCDDSDPGRAPHLSELCDDGIDQDCDGEDATSVVLALLPGWGSGSVDTSLIWPNFQTTWGSYGTCEVTLQDVGPGFDLATIQGTGASAVVITDPAGNSVVYSSTERQAIVDFAQGGGGVIVTYLLSWNGWDNTQMFDNSSLSLLVGVDPNALSATHAANVGTVVDVLDATHPLNNGLGASYSVTPYGYAQGKAVTSWDDALLSGATVVAEASDGGMATIAYEGPGWRGVWFTGMADYQSGAPQAMYNAALWVGAN